jgi:hypothetical protein
MISVNAVANKNPAASYWIYCLHHAVEMGILPGTTFFSVHVQAKIQIDTIPELDIT